MKLEWFAWAMTALLGVDDDRIEFNRDVRPILARACFQCHGFDAKARKGELRLDVPEFAARKSAQSAAIVPGNAEASELWKRITSHDADFVMPPPDSHKQLSDPERRVLRRWIEEGAKYQKHWSFEPLRRPAIRGDGTLEAAIDELIARRATAKGLRLNGIASKEIQIRRAAFALTGLPPSLGELEAYSSDASPKAYETVVDKYLASPQFGEEMARHWLDVARYADTHGLHLDNERQMWLYRDWIVRAFNENLPFDRFTVWQVAGDLLPNPSIDQLTATGFNRCNVTTGEGGALDAEFRYRYAVERTATVAQAWLGLTAGCAVCHDHKFDPLTMKEFYSLYAFFNDAADPPMDGNTNNTPPFVKAPHPSQQAAADAAGKVEQQAKTWLELVARSVDYRDPAEGKSPGARKRIVDVVFDDQFGIGTHSRSSSRNATDWLLAPPFGAPSGRRVLRQASSTSYDDRLEFRLRPLVVPDGAVVRIWARVDPFEIPHSISIAWEGKPRVAWQREGQVLRRERFNDQSIEPGRWTQLAISAEQAGLKPGDRLTGLTIAQNGGIVYWDRLTIEGASDPKIDPLESFAVWRQGLGKNGAAELPADIRDLVAPEQDRKPKIDRNAPLQNWFVALIARPATDEVQIARDVWEAARTARIIAEESAPGTFVYRDVPKPRDSFVMLRGQYDKPAEAVHPGVPAVLPPLATRRGTARANRLDLAQWLVARENPLTARVAVNRIWQQLFGVGLVKTSFDFGTQGDAPSHPELLDLLAADFIENGWNVKRLVKQIVMTSAFRRDSATAVDARGKDPENRWLARGPRLRLDAEQVRDAALFAAGLLDLTRGGRGVNVYQPPNIWEPVGYADSNTRFYLQDHGPALYRRSIYVFLKRTAPAPFMANFDAPNREQICTVRERTNTPLQALQLLNDVQFFEAARALAERALADGGGSDADRIAYLYRVVLSRRPAARESAAIATALETQRRIFANDPKAANLAIHVGESQPRGKAAPAEIAAWTLVANTMLNLDEAIVRN